MKVLAAFLGVLVLLGGCRPSAEDAYMAQMRTASKPWVAAVEKQSDELTEALKQAASAPKGEKTGQALAGTAQGDREMVPVLEKMRADMSAITAPPTKAAAHAEVIKALDEYIRACRWVLDNPDSVNQKARDEALRKFGEATNRVGLK
jgi:hypothetical protein